ncbi:MULTISPECIES: chorismate mutase [Rhizobium]|uniref:chorismate mutase n=1 Tax=Rhizobium tropici TaxID=398 RepID=A0A6P1C8Q8_RHITR|nr:MULTISPECIES: chorismate mutase [Rhizobium]AGB73165.1 chorismate mutase [Rhizobium tropici CIAT 899]MBB4243673.1 chorismate mutase [Rhizobium tropici]MBB5595878.1 chorismate mutase [Rhizobium tropici]MBB6493870.1 chorismate mutase [Rhizobium tropici]NEV11314.1 chorismate mutase [Rhizobium tropici]
MNTQNTSEQLASYRKTIDNLDSALLHILAERFRCTEQVGNLKAEQAMPATDSERERRQMDRLRNIANELGLDQQFVDSLMKLIVGTVVKRHKEIAAQR